MAKLRDAFHDRKCATWSPDWLPHGGPNPDGPYSDVDWKDYRKKLVNLLDERIKSGKSKKRDRRDVTDQNVRHRRDVTESFFDSDVFDNYFIQVQSDGERSAGLALQRALNADQGVALTQILVGYMKWSFRYMSDCVNAAEENAADQHAVRVYDFVEHTLADVYDIINDNA